MHKIASPHFMGRISGMNLLRNHAFERGNAEGFRSRMLEDNMGSSGFLKIRAVSFRRKEPGEDLKRPGRPAIYCILTVGPCQRRGLGRSEIRLDCCQTDRPDGAAASEYLRIRSCIQALRSYHVSYQGGFCVRRKDEDIRTCPQLLSF